MKLKPYDEILKMGKEAVDAMMLPIRARQMRKAGELEMAKLEEKQLSLQNEITMLCAENPIKYEKILDRMDELALVERRIQQFQGILNDLFPTGN